MCVHFVVNQRWNKLFSKFVSIRKIFNLQYDNTLNGSSFISGKHVSQMGCAFERRTILAGSTKYIFVSEIKTSTIHIHNWAGEHIGSYHLANFSLPNDLQIWAMCVSKDDDQLFVVIGNEDIAYFLAFKIEECK